MSTFVTPTRLSPYKSTTFENSLVTNQKRKKGKESLFWGIINIVLLSVILYDLSNDCISWVWYIQYCKYVAAIVLTLNVFYHMFRCLYVQLTFHSTVNENDHNPSKRVLYHNSPPNLNRSSTWKSQSVPNKTTPGETPNYSLTSSSWVYCRNATSISPVAASSPKDNVPQRVQYVSGVDSIQDEDSLNRYLKDYENYEKNSSIIYNQNLNMSTESPISSFWSHPASKSNKNASPMLWRCQYQLASPTTTATTNSPKSDDKNMKQSLQSQSLEMWRRLNVNSVAIMQWNENLRVWLSQTILERLIKEFDYIDDSLHKHGFTDVTIGGVGLDRLRKTAQMSPILQSIPSLSVVMPFLELTTNQEYMVKRIRELSTGGCMSEFKWNGGSSYNGKEWDISLPTDSAIIMHLFASYMDTQLLPQPNKPDARPFSGFHFLKANDKIHGPYNQNELVIQEASENPPHYRVIVGEETYEMVKGYNNLFHSILLFLYFVNKREHGMLGLVNLGKSGINILWIIDS